ncbi:hypothetical protein NOR51B_2092 [Luminiphilus syltensis NOR5-1B]|uniref:Lipoprotein n=1 Tax=Luminiphilus syltensis NOR5-1B TaxID=565045 RepID=B8KVH1_9GAMM|nr:hypothetical protein [Luminiphilus syltensis]EED36144.1 hypothetical protein NOR51B_2092 [Luminiphilus syltensis NOR5-1B]
MRKLPIIVTAAFAALLALAGCISQSLPEERLPEFSVISLVLPQFKPKQGEQITWLTDIVIAGDFPTEVRDRAASEITARVEQGLSSLGFTVNTAEDSDYVLVAAVVAGLTKNPSDEQNELLELIRLYPMLGGRSGRYERDMLVLAITTRDKVGDGNPLWKAAVEVYSAYQLHLPEEIQLQRLDAAIARLLATLPDMKYAY